ncbi:hypothetical protein ACHAXS_004152 [Conticribra weissflogii]
MQPASSPPKWHNQLPADDHKTQHNLDVAVEIVDPPKCGRSVGSLTKRGLNLTVQEQTKIDKTTKKLEELVKRTENAVEWMQHQTKIFLAKKCKGNSNENANTSLTQDEAQSLRDRLASELRYCPFTSDPDNIDYDPLRYWVLYIEHIQKSYPSDSERQFLLMERCAQAFMSRPFIMPSYQNDLRFIEICISYAGKTSCPNDVFKRMCKLEVGRKVSLFWVAWAWVAEKSEDYNFTEEIFQEALSVGAEPKQFLELRQKQFLRRMSRHWLNACKAARQQGSKAKNIMHAEHWNER